MNSSPAPNATSPASDAEPAAIGPLSSPVDISAGEEARKPGRPRRKEADGAILDATLLELVKHGYSGLSMDRVASRAGVSKATIYRRWPSREEMILDAWRRLDAGHQDNPPDTGTLRGDLMVLCGQYAEAMGSNEMLGLLPQMVGAVHQNAQLEALFARFVDEQMQPLYTVYARARDRGEMRAGFDVQLAAKLLAGTIFFSLLIEGKSFPPEHLRASIEMVTSGLVDPAYVPAPPA